MTNKIIVAKSGFNARTETDPDNINYSSDYDSLKYEIVGTKVVSVNRANYYHSVAASPPFPAVYYNRATATFAHGLGYTPYFSGYFIDGAGAGNDIQTPFLFGDAGFVASLAVFADSTNLHFLVQFNTTFSSGTVNYTFKYRIFKNDLGL